MFEESLVSSRLARQPRRRKTFAGVAFVTHAVFFLAMLFFQYWHVDALPEPPQRFAFFTALAAPPPPPPVRLIAPSPAAPQTAAPPAAAPLQPAPEPAAPFPVQPSDVPAGAPERVEGSGGPAAGSGPIGLPGDGQGSGDGSGGAEVGLDQVLTVGGAVTRPVATFQPQPRYTETARKVRLQGAVILESIIDRQGRVTDVRVIKGLGLGLTDEAVKIVRQWTFEPATLNGQPVAVYYTLTISFRLQ